MHHTYETEGAIWGILLGIFLGVLFYLTGIIEASYIPLLIGMGCLAGISIGKCIRKRGNINGKRKEKENSQEDNKQKNK